MGKPADCFAESPAARASGGGEALHDVFTPLLR